MADDKVPRITKISAMPASEAKWVEFRKIDWIDAGGHARVWEAAARKTRGRSGIDAVAIAPILRYPAATNKPPATLVVLQYRPAVEAVCVEFPAGLIDAAETPAEAAVRELREETGLEGKVTSLSPTMVSDPGMTNANMQFAIVEVELASDDALPEQQLDEGEYIQRVVVPLHELHQTLVKYSEQEGTIVDARLFHWAAGLEFAKTMI